MAGRGDAILIGVKRHWVSGLRSILAVIGGTWLLTEIFNYFVPQLQEWLIKQAPLPLIAVCLLTLGTFLHSVYERREIAFEIPTTQTKVVIKYGDLFDEPADLIIAVNEFFDGELGQIVSARSVHGQYITRCQNSDASQFRQIVDPILATYQGTQVARPITPDIAFPIGTTVKLPMGQFSAYLVALTRTDLQTHKATTSIAELWIAITNALESLHHLNNGAPVALPLIGNGLSGLNIPPQHVLRMVVLAVVLTARRIQLPSVVTIVLHENCFDKIDINEIRSNWRP